MITLERWSAANGMRINENKTKAVIFRAKNKIIPCHQDIILSTRKIEIVNNFKCLGTIFSDNMTWDCHVGYVLQKLAQVTGVIGRIRYLLQKKN